MRFARTAALAGIAATLLGTMTLAAALPASADTGPVGPLFPPTANATDYALTVRGMDIYQAQPDAAKAAWSAQLGRVAAANANVYRAAQVYGTMDPVQIADVIPLNKAADVALSGKLTPGLSVTNGVKSWAGTGFRFPRFPTSVLSAARGAVGGPFGGLVAITAFSQRADIANGVASWVGIDANGAVCSDPVAGGHNPLNWITGQNCDQWQAGQDFKPNVAVVPQVAGWPYGSYVYTTGPNPLRIFQCAAVDEAMAGAAGTLHCGVIQNTLADSPANTTQWFQGSMSYICGTAAGQQASKVPTWTSSADPALPQGGGQIGWQWSCDSGDTLLAFGNFPAYPAAGTYGDPASMTTVDKAFAACNGYKSPDGDTRPCYFGPATTHYTPGVTGNPDRQVQCTLYGASGNVTNGLTGAVSEETIKTSGMPQPVCTPLPNSEDPNRMVLTEIGGGQSNVYYDKAQTSAAADFDTKYKADCGTSPAQHSCLLDLVQTSNGISCFSASSNCADWFNDSARDSKYQCQYGGKNETMQQCFVYANVFDAQKRAAGNPYADPLTGQDPGQGTGSDLDTQTMGNPAGSVIQSNGSVSSCYGGGSPGAFNPVSWIVRGGQCLLNWAFVPRPLAVQASMNQVSNGWQANGIGKLVTAVGGWHISPVVAGCSSNLAFPVPMIHKVITVPIIQACPGTPMGDFAPWVRGLVSAGLVITAGFAVKRIISGWIPA